MSQRSELVLRGGTILTIDPAHRVLTGDVASVDGVITHVGGAYTPVTPEFSIVASVVTRPIGSFSIGHLLGSILVHPHIVPCSPTTIMNCRHPPGSSP